MILVTRQKAVKFPPANLLLIHKFRIKIKELSIKSVIIEGQQMDRNVRSCSSNVESKQPPTFCTRNGNICIIVNYKYYHHNVSGTTFSHCLCCSNTAHIYSSF